MKILFTADWHFRADTPICRKDDFFNTQKNTIVEIYDIAEAESAGVIIVGDIFDKAKPDDSQILESFLIDQFNRAPTKLIAGNHDLLYHKIENKHKGSYGVLEKIFNNDQQDGDGIKIHYFDYGVEITDCEDNGLYNIAMIHKYCDKDIPFFIKDGISTKDLFKNYNYDLFVTGDNHHFFLEVEKSSGRKILNCGCITRQASNFIDYIPMVHIFDTDTKEIKHIELSDTDKSAIDTGYMEEAKQRDERLISFISKLQGDVDIDRSFKQNLKEYIATNKIPKKVEEKIWKVLQ